MIDTSPAIEKSGVNTIYIRKGNGVMAISDGKNPNGKWNIIDLCFGSIHQAIAELKSQGYTIKPF